jgi:hypothetical protein
VLTKISAGDFDSLFAQLLDEKIRSGAKLDSTLIQECYELAATSLGLPQTNSAHLHIKDITALLEGRRDELINLGSQKAKKLIFDLVYVH